MPIRDGDGFSWTGGRYGDQWRVVGAIALIAAGWGIGFFSGRMSAWVFPVTHDNTSARLAVIEQTLARVTAASTATPAPTAQSGPPAKTDEGLPPQQPTNAADFESTGQKLARETVQKSGPAETKGPTADADTASAEPDAPVQREKDDIAIINRDWKQLRSSARYRDAEIDRDPTHDERAYAACERRYASFRRSDGTYQPYGRSSRELCPLLR